MNTKPQFHGSDLEKIEKHYNIPKESIVKFAANVNPLGISENIKNLLKDNLDVISSYPDREYTDLRNSIADYLSIDADTILTGNGSTELISLLIQQRLPKKALLLGPTYSEYSKELSLSNCIQEYHLLNSKDNFKLDTDELFKKLDEGFDMFIMCNPNNPTSSAVLNDQMKEILDGCKKRNIFVMIDETYVEFAPEDALVTSVPFTKEYDNLIVLRGVSKFFASPGLRFGYAITSNEDFRKNVKEHQIPWSVNSVAAFAGEHYFKDYDFINKTKELINSERTRLYNELSNIEGINIFPAYANFFLIKICTKGITSYDVFEACIKKGLMIRDCSSFSGLDGEFVRFCIMNKDNNNQLLEVLKSVIIPTNQRIITHETT